MTIGQLVQVLNHFNHSDSEPMTMGQHGQRPFDLL